MEKNVSFFADRSHAVQHLQTVLTPAQEIAVVYLRRTLQLCFDSCGDPKQALLRDVTLHDSPASAASAGQSNCRCSA